MTDQPSGIDLCRAALDHARTTPKTMPEATEQDPEQPEPMVNDSYIQGAQKAREALLAHRDDPPPEPTPVRTRENASDGYRRVRAVYLNTRRPAA